MYLFRRKNDNNNNNDINNNNNPSAALLNNNGNGSAAPTAAAIPAPAAADPQQQQEAAVTPLPSPASRVAAAVTAVVAGPPLPLEPVSQPVTEANLANISHLHIAPTGADTKISEEARVRQTYYFVELEKHERLKRELTRLKDAIAEHPELRKSYFVRECAEVMRKTVPFSHMNEAKLLELASKARRVRIPPQTVFVKHGDPHRFIYFIAEGEVYRTRVIDGHEVEVDYREYNTAVGILAFIDQQPASSFATARNDVVVYQLATEDIIDFLKKNPLESVSIISALSERLRFTDGRPTIPLLAQRRQKQAPVWVVSIAAAIESFYRSALNAMLNRQLQGASTATKVALFPHMHVQIPMRVGYINGFKQLRFFLDNSVDARHYSNPAMLQILLAITPGIVMTPMSSVLEASNAGHSNPEPMLRRATRGITFRSVREIIFGIGLNQLSDYFEERVPIENRAMRNAAGSLAAGIVSGYLSHIPHNLSAMKLMQPDMTYGQHFSVFAKRYERQMGHAFGTDKNLRRIAAGVLCVLFPTGITIRITQIVGTFCIINGFVGLHLTVTSPPTDARE
eukprot:PhM_4_TR8275/c0_g1_i1/m.53413